MKNNITRMAVCPLCGRVYHGAPALSREDNETLICPDCGTRQALQSIGVDNCRAGADHRDDPPPHAGVRYTIRANMYTPKGK